MPRNKNVTKDQPEDRVVAEETTTLPEGAVLSVYRVRTGKLGHEVTRLVALHGAGRVEMKVDDIKPQNLRQYLELVRQHIARLRNGIEVKPSLDPLMGSKPNDFRQFVWSMAFHGMFIFEALTDDDGDKTTTTKEVVQRRRKVQKRSQVCADGDGTMRGSGETKADRGRAKQ